MKSVPQGLKAEMILLGYVRAEARTYLPVPASTYLTTPSVLGFQQPVKW